MRIRDRERRIAEPTAGPWVHQPESAKTAINGNTKRAIIARAAKRIAAKRSAQVPADKEYRKYLPNKTLRSLVFARPKGNP